MKTKKRMLILISLIIYSTLVLGGQVYAKSTNCELQKQSDESGISIGVLTALLSLYDDEGKEKDSAYDEAVKERDALIEQRDEIETQIRKHSRWGAFHFSWR